MAFTSLAGLASSSGGGRYGCDGRYEKSTPAIIVGGLGSWSPLSDDGAKLELGGVGGAGRSKLSLGDL